MRRLFLILMLWVTAMNTPIHAESLLSDKDLPNRHTLEESSWGLSQLMALRTKVTHAFAEFTELKNLSVLDKPLMMKGLFNFVAPSHLEKHVMYPHNERLIIEGDSLTIIKKHKNEIKTISLQNHPDLWAIIEGFRSTLSGDIVTLEKFYETSLEGHRQQWQLTLVPRKASMRAIISNIVINGQLANISEIITYENNGDYSQMKINLLTQ